MYQIIDTRGSGKTSQLMQLAKEKDGIFVCANPHAMRTKAHAYGLTGFDIISYNEYFSKQFDKDKPVFIDELQNYIQHIQKNRLDGYTLTIGD